VELEVGGRHSEQCVVEAPLVHQLIHGQPPLQTGTPEVDLALAQQIPASLEMVTAEGYWIVTDLRLKQPDSMCRD
jgi:hypothetical protein